MNRQPSLVKIITVDYTGFVGLTLVLTPWGLYLVLAVTQVIDTSNTIYLVINTVLNAVGIALLIWRIRMFNLIFRDGSEVSATISNVSFFRDRGRVHYVYIHQGKKYIGGNAVLKGKRTQELKVGDEVVVMVDRDNPKRACIRDFYM